MSSKSSKALVLFSGGQDSTTLLFWAKKRFSEVQAITFDYQQRNKIEVDYAKKIASQLKIKQVIFPVNTFAALGGSSLTSDNISVEVQLSKNKIPNTFVPGRNLVFLVYSAAYAYQKNIQHMITGVNEMDYSGYPDCRDNSIRAIELAIQFGMHRDIQIHTPLMFLSKKQIWKLAYDLSCFDFIKNQTLSCYNGIVKGCNACNACILRQEGLKYFEKEYIISGNEI